MYYIYVHIHIHIYTHIYKYVYICTYTHVTMPHEQHAYLTCPSISQMHVWHDSPFVTNWYFPRARRMPTFFAKNCGKPSLAACGKASWISGGTCDFQKQNCERGGGVWGAVYGRGDWIHLRHIATHCNTLQQTATHCNVQQQTATHCNILQHTATHRNILQHTWWRILCNETKLN